MRSVYPVIASILSLLHARLYQRSLPGHGSHPCPRNGLRSCAGKALVVRGALHRKVACCASSRCGAPARPFLLAARKIAKAVARAGVRTVAGHTPAAKKRPARRWPCGAAIRSSYGTLVVKGVVLVLLAAPPQGRRTITGNDDLTRDGKRNLVEHDERGKHEQHRHR